MEYYEDCIICSNCGSDHVERLNSKSIDYNCLVCGFKFRTLTKVDKIELEKLFSKRK